MPSTYAHNDKAQFSMSIDRFINKLTNYHRHNTRSKQVCSTGTVSKACHVYTSTQMALKQL